MAEGNGIQRELGSHNARLDAIEATQVIHGQKLDLILEIVNRGRGALWLTTAAGGVSGILGTGAVLLARAKGLFQ